MVEVVQALVKPGEDPNYETQNALRAADAAIIGDDPTRTCCSNCCSSGVPTRTHAG